MAGELVVVKGLNRGEFVKIGELPVTIGRSSSCDLALKDDSKASHNHVRITPMGGERFILEDLGSTNGTEVNGEHIEQIPLRSGDLIRIGRSLIIFRDGGSAVCLEDIDLVGGGSSQSIARREADEVEAAASSSSNGLPHVEEATASMSEALESLVLAAGEVSLARSLDLMLSVLRGALGAGRALLFLRRPLTGGLGCAASVCQEGGSANAPVDPEILQRAIAGEAVAVRDIAVSPVRILGLLAGALYIDGCEKSVHKVGLLSSAGVLIGLRVGLDRSRQLASSATEIVALAQAQVNKRSFDLIAQVRAAERLFAPAARRRGLGWEAKLPSELRGVGDPILFGRGLDKLLEHVVGDARGHVRITVRPSDGKLVRLLVHHGSTDSEEILARQVDPHGVPGDLRRAAETFGDGALAVARVCFLRGGARFTPEPGAKEMVFALELEAPEVMNGSSSGFN